MVSKTHKNSESRQDKSESRSCRTKPELAEFFESVDERMKSLAIARKPYKARNDKEISVKPGDVFEVLDDYGTWWCLRAPSGKAGHVPKSHLEAIPHPMTPYGRSYDSPTDPRVPVIVKTSVQLELGEEISRSRTPSARPGQNHQVTRSSSPFSIPATPPAMNRPLSQLPPQMSPSRRDRSPATRTYVKEPGHRSTEFARKQHKTRSSSNRPQRFSRSSSSSNSSLSSSDDSSNYENQPRKSYGSRGIHNSRAHSHRSPSGCNGHMRSHCREGAPCPVHCVRHSCPVHCMKDKRSSQSPPHSPARSDSSQDKPPQQVFIILEPPKQEQSPAEVEQAAAVSASAVTAPEEYQQDGTSTAPIQILVTPGGQFTSSMTVAPQFPQYGQAVQQTSMQMGGLGNMPWFNQPYYQTYA